MGDVEGGEDKSVLERRATVRLVNYWMSLRRSHAIPAFVDFDPHRNPIGWDHCLLASCGGPADVVLEHVGAALAEVDLDEAAVPGARLDMLGFVKEILAPLSQAIGSGEPQHCGGAYRIRGPRRMLYRSVLLPFRSLDAVRHYVLGAATYRIDAVVLEEAAGTVAGYPREDRREDHPGADA
jgi:hypothetical protein